MEPKGYELGRSGRDEAIRYRKAQKIIRLLQEYGELRARRVLEVGTGAGYIAHALSEHAASVDSVDIIDYRKLTVGYTQRIVTDESLPYPDAQFDIVVSNHVLEHVRNQEKQMREMARVLKPGGIIYLATPNKWWLTDPHYKLPFISWLPRVLAGRYLWLAKRRRWDIYSLSSRQLHKLAASNGLMVTDKAWDVIRNPQQYQLDVPGWLAGMARLLPACLTTALLPVIPTHLKILRKQ